MLDYSPDLDQAAIDAAHEFSQSQTAVVQTLSSEELASLRAPQELQGQIERFQANIFLQKLRLEPETAQSLLAEFTPEIAEALGASESVEVLQFISQHRNDRHADYAAKVAVDAHFKRERANSLFDSLLAIGAQDTANIISLFEGNQRAEELARGSVQALLRSAIQTLPSSVRHQFSGQDDTTYLMDAIAYLPSHKARQLLLDMHALSRTEGAARTELSRDWDNAIQSLNSYERAELVNSILDTYSDSVSYRRVQTTLESSSSLEELCSIVARIGEETLLDSGHGGIKELCAMASLFPAVTGVAFPATPASNASVAESRRCLEETIKAYEQIVDLCQNSEQYRNTNTAADLGITALSAIADIKTDLHNWELRKTQQEHPADTVSSDATITTEGDGGIFIQGRMAAPAVGDLRVELQELASTYLKMAELEKTYGVNFTYATTSLLDLLAPEGHRGMPLWSMDELNAIEAGLEAIPIEHTLFTPRLREIQKVSMIAPGVLAARYSDGKVRITPQASTSEEMKRHYPDIHPLTFVFVHELGHSIQIGDENGGLVRTSDGSLDMASGEEKYDFDAFTAISDWQAIETNRFELVLPANRNTPLKVKLDGEEYELGKEITHRGKQLILQIDPSGRSLYSCDAESDFASRWYAQANPWEDFAETFAEYMLTPERLIRLAPEKFLHMEAEFKKYSNNGDLEYLLRTQLLSST